MRRTFRSLANHNFRIWFVTGLISNIGTWMQTTAQSWVVLTELTANDAVAVGITMALQFAPQILLVPIAGLIADRFDRRRLLIGTQLALTSLTIGIGVLLASGAAELWHFLLFALAFGIVTAIDQPARNAIVSDLVGEDRIANAVALNLASHHSARLIGPAVAGIVIAVLGSGWVFVLNAVTFLPLVIGLLSMRRAELIASPRASRRRSEVFAGFRYVAGRPDLRIVLIMLFLFGMIGMNFVLFATTMAVEFGADASQFGILTSVMAIGSLAGALLAAGRERARIRTIVIAGAALGLSVLAASVMPTFWTFAWSTIAIGMAGVMTFTTANGYMQSATTPALRGRVISIHMAVLAAGTPIGAPIIGWFTNEFGPRPALGAGVVLAAIACSIGIGWYLTGRRRSNTPGGFAPPQRSSITERGPQGTLDTPLDLSAIVSGDEPATNGERQ